MEKKIVTFFKYKTKFASLTWSKKMAREASALTPPSFWLAQPSPARPAPGCVPCLREGAQRAPRPRRRILPAHRGHRGCCTATPPRQGRPGCWEQTKPHSVQSLLLFVTLGFLLHHPLGLSKEPSVWNSALYAVFHFFNLDQKELYLLCKEIPQQTYPKEKIHVKLCVEVFPQLTLKYFDLKS